MDKKDRYIISNQLRILEALVPDDAKYYAECRMAFDEGYVEHYNWAMEHIVTTELSPDVTREVVDTLDMYRAIYFFKRDNPEENLNEYDIKFKGYDGNDQMESRLLGYARYFVIDLNRFSEVIEEQGEHFDFNSHCEMRAKYERMLKVWLAIPTGTEPGSRHNLAKNQLSDILEA